MSPTPEGTPNISPVIQQTTIAIVVANMGDEEEET
jgi:chemotaxis response regulator CheB